MITTVLRGGLGNQMFEYAIGRSLAIKNKTKLYLDLTELKKDKKRVFELYHMNIESEVLNNNLSNKIKHHLIKKLRTKKKLFKFLELFMNFKYLLEKNPPNYNRHVLEQRGNLYLDGYWQCEKYFKDIREIIISDFNLKEKLNENNKLFLNKIKNSNSVSLHIRRGDYVTEKHTNEVHGTCSFDYYKKSIDLISKSVNDINIFVFSDDLEWVRKNLHTNQKTFLVDANDANSGYNDLILMSNCKHFIVANSSFSWWGAWLSKNKNKIVCAPKKWFQKMNEGDIVPKTWVRI